MRNSPLPTAKPGERILPAHNEVVRAINDLRLDAAGFNLDAAGIGPDPRVGDRIPYVIADAWLGVIQEQGFESGDEAYTDARYYVKRQAVKVDITAKDQLEVTPELVPSAATAVTATNLAELSAGSHSLSEGEVVFVVAVFARTTPLRRHYFFYASASSIFLARLGTASPGDPTGYAFTEQTQGEGGAWSTKTGGRTDESMKFPAYDPAGSEGLDEGAIVHIYQSADPATGNKAYSIVRDVLAVTADPLDMSGSGLTADSQTWSYQGTQGASVSIVTRIVDDSSGEQLLQFARIFSFDANGRVVSIGEETMTVVVATDSDCV